MSAGEYLRYAPSLEQIGPEEAKDVAEIVASIKRTSDRTATNGHRIRQQHAKGVGFLRGKLTVYDGLPDHLRQGLFEEARDYPIIVRLSTAFNKSDRVRSPRGFAIKVLGVTGPKALADDNSTNQDILLVNHASYFADTKAYLDGAQRNFERSLIFPDFLFRIGGFSSRVAVALADKTGIHIPMLLRALGDPGNNILGETFHTEGALRFGDYVARLRVVPLSDSLRKLTGQPCHDGDDVVLESVVDFFRSNPAEYELRAQLCTDLTRTPIEDASIDWPEDVSEPQPLGKITLPRQAADSPVRRRYANEVLSFDPWRCLEAHRPLGSIMRLRRDAYRMSRMLRQQNQGMANQPPGEPREIADLPD